MDTRSRKKFRCKKSFGFYAMPLARIQLNCLVCVAFYVFPSATDLGFPEKFLACNEIQRIVLRNKITK